MTRFDEVARMQTGEKAATRAPWRLLGYVDFQLVADDPEFYINFGNTGAADPELIRDMRNAAPWLLEAAACFQPGDARCVKAILGIIRAATGPETDSDELDCLRRLQKAAEIMEDE